MRGGRRFVPYKPGVFLVDNMLFEWTPYEGGGLLMSLPDPVIVVERLDSAAVPRMAWTLFEDGYELGDAIEASRLLED